MNIKGSALITAMSLSLLGGSINTAFAYMVESNDLMQNKMHSQQHNRYYYNNHARIHDHMSMGAPNDHAALANGVVFEQVNILKGNTHYTDGFEITKAGTYEATLTDFDFPNPLKMAGLNITTSTESLGTLLETGSFTFDADAGNYYLSFFAEADDMGQYGIKIAQYGILISEVNTSTVPVPAAAWLFGSGLIALTGIIRKKSV